MSLSIEYARRVRSLRDEITASYFGGFGAQEREISFVLAKLDEAEAWLVWRALGKGEAILKTRAELADIAHAIAQREEATVTTETTIVGEGAADV